MFHFCARSDVHISHLPVTHCEISAVSLCFLQHGCSCRCCKCDKLSLEGDEHVCSTTADRTCMPAPAHASEAEPGATATAMASPSSVEAAAAQLDGLGDMAATELRQERARHDAGDPKLRAQHLPLSSAEPSSRLSPRGSQLSADMPMPGATVLDSVVVPAAADEATRTPSRAATPAFEHHQRQSSDVTPTFTPVVVRQDALELLQVPTPSGTRSSCSCCPSRAALTCKSSLA